MAQSTATMTTTPEEQLASLEAILAAVQRTRVSLPALVKTVLPDSPLQPPQTAAERATAYRTASTECHVAIRPLADQLEAVEAILAETDQSELRDKADIVVRPITANGTAPKRKSAVDENKPTWARVGEILAAGGTSAQVRANEPYKPVHPVPTTTEQLDALLAAWNEAHKRVIAVVSERSRADRPTEVQLTLRGVMRAKVALRWANNGTNGDTRCEADYIVCHGLKEEKPIHVDSQFSLFRSISNEAMLVLHRARLRASESQEDVALLEEVLAFLSNPPLPF